MQNKKIKPKSTSHL